MADAWKVVVIVIGSSLCKIQPIPSHDSHKGPRQVSAPQAADIGTLDRKGELAMKTLMLP